MPNDQFINNLCWLIFSLAFLTATLLYYAFIIQPKQFEKRAKRYADKKEIDQLFTDEDDYFSETEYAEFSNSEAVRN